MRRKRKEREREREEMGWEEKAQGWLDWMKSMRVKEGEGAERMTEQEKIEKELGNGKMIIVGGLGLFLLGIGGGIVATKSFASKRYGEAKIHPSAPGLAGKALLYATLINGALACGVVYGVSRSMEVTNLKEFRQRMEEITPQLTGITSLTYNPDKEQEESKDQEENLSLSPSSPSSLQNNNNNFSEEEDKKES